MKETTQPTLLRARFCFAKWAKQALAQSIRLLVITALLVGLGTMAALAPVAYAADFTVNNANDVNDANPGDGVCETDLGFCTLRAAISEANALGGSHTITLSANTIYFVTGSPGEDDNASGDLDIKVSLTIQGAGIGSTIMDGAAIDRVLDIDPTGIGGLIVNISGVTIRNGAAPAGTTDPFVVNGGGGIRNNGGTVSVTNSAISENRVAGTIVVAGAGIYNKNSGTLTITNSTISDNELTAGSGAGIYNDESDVNIINSTISGNRVVGASFQGGGGGIFNLISTMNIVNSTISGNQANSMGGGIINFAGTLNIANSTITGNEVKRHGGGIASVGNFSTTNLTHVTITNNTADADDDDSGRGGGIHSVGGTVNLKNTIVAGNTNANNATPGQETPDIHEFDETNIAFKSQGYNLIGNVGDTNFIHNATGDRYGDPKGTTTPNAGATESVTASGRMKQRSFFCR